MPIAKQVEEENEVDRMRVLIQNYRRFLILRTEIKKSLNSVSDLSEEHR